MNSFTRGIRNAFRNMIRTGSVVVILAISIGLALIMLISLFAVNDRIDSVRASVGNTVTVTPAGIRGFQGGGELLTQTDANTVKGLNHVSDVEQTFYDRLEPGTNTSLQSAIDPGSFGNRNSGNGGGGSEVQEQGPPGGGMGGGAFGGRNGQPMTLPVTVQGVEDNPSLQALGVDSVNIVSGEALPPGQSDNVAVIGTQLAAKNNLQVGSTFTAYDTQVRVTGIFDAGNQFTNSSMVMPIDTIRKLAGSEGQINSMIVTTGSSTDVQAVSDSIKSALGSKADVVSQLDSTSSALSSLESVKNITRYSLIGALVSASAILFLIMLMIVRERRQEIGVLKAIGASNFKIMKQFISESLTFTLLGSVAGIVLGVIFSNPMLNMLVNSSTQQNVRQGMGGAFRGGAGGPPGGGAAMMRGGPGGLAVNASQSALQNLHAVISYDLLLYGLLAAVIIAVIGSSIPAWTIAKIRPAEAMRGE